MRIVPDASAIVEVLFGTRTGRAVASRLTGARLIAPALLDVEVAAALRRMQLTGMRPDDWISNALATLTAWPIRRVGHRRLVVPSRAWWSNVTAYDATYLAVAHSYNAPILTVDGPLSRAPVPDVVVENVRVG